MKINICVTFNEGRSLWKSLGKWPSSMESNIYANMHLASSLGFCSTCPLLILLLHRPSLLSVCPFSVLGLCLCVTGVPLCPCSVCVSVCYCWRNTDVSARLPGWPTVSQTHLCAPLQTQTGSCLSSKDPTSLLRKTLKLYKIQCLAHLFCFFVFQMSEHLQCIWFWSSRHTNMITVGKPKKTS